MRLDRDEFTVIFDASRITSDTLIQTIQETGYSAQLVTISTPQETTPQPSVPTDLEPLASALREAEQKHKPLLVEFRANWCIPCKRMERETFRDPTVVDLLSLYVVLTIDTDEQTELAKAFGIAGIPDIRLLSPNGEHHKQLQGFQTATAIIPELQIFLDHQEHSSPLPVSKKQGRNTEVKKVAKSAEVVSISRSE